MKEIKNIIFDLGGVLLDIDFLATQKAFEQLGYNQFHKHFTQHHANDLFEQLEIGAVSNEQFYNMFRQEATLNLSDEAIKNAWNAMLLHFSKEKMQWLESVSQKYRVYLFSNTNQIHYDYFTQSFLEEVGGRTLNSYFTKAWYSHQLGMRKPYAASFTALLEKEKLMPSETLFIDDTIGNIEGASAAGLLTIHLQAPQSILDLNL